MVTLEQGGVRVRDEGDEAIAKGAEMGMMREMKEMHVQQIETRCPDTG